MAHSIFDLHMRLRPLSEPLHLFFDQSKKACTVIDLPTVQNHGSLLHRFDLGRTSPLLLGTR
ncbi:hypothetical protein ACP4OV_028198 [Aristida adscensionis]